MSRFHREWNEVIARARDVCFWSKVNIGSTGALPPFDKFGFDLLNYTQCRRHLFFRRSSHNLSAAALFLATSRAA